MKQTDFVLLQFYSLM